jgi:glycosyltransferase involved in cell wall biosynthesis
MLRNLFVIASQYFSFTKDQTEAIAPFFQNIQVFVRYNPLAEISSILPIKGIDNFRLDQRISKVNLPSNVHIMPIPLLYLPIDFNYKRLGNAHYKKINRHIQKENLKDGIIHAHHTWSAGYVGARLKEEYGTPFIVTGHGYDVYSLPFKDEKWRQKIEYVLNNANHIITVSQSNLRCIRKLNVSTPVSVIMNGFKKDLFYLRDSADCRKLLGLPLNRKIALTVANLEPVKGLEYLITALTYIVKKRNDILCVIVGSGSRYNYLMRQIHQSGLEKNVLLVGRRPHEEIPIWMGASDVVILSSLNEGNPTVMFEALGCGKPFVGTKVGGVDEVITSIDYGLLVKPADPDDLAEKILMALDQEWDRNKILGYAERYTWENIAKEIVGVYNHVLG